MGVKRVSDLNVDDVLVWEGEDAAVSGLDSGGPGLVDVFLCCEAYTDRRVRLRPYDRVVVAYDARDGEWDYRVRQGSER